MTLHTNHFLKFLNEDEKILKLKELGLLSPKAKKSKPFLYKGIYSSETVECNINGYLEGENGIHTVIINLNDSNHPIHPDHLKDMQKANFSRL